jgi:predicted dehydrogenase
LVAVAVAPARVLNVGVAGLGEAATEFLPAYSRHPHLRLAACADARPAAIARFQSDFPGAHAYADVRELCADPDLDVIVVATNHDFHRDPVVWAAQSGKHVVVEKPMALTLDDCDAMIEACERAGVLLLGGHSHSYDAPIRRLAELVRSGELGRLRMINAWNFNDFMVRPYPDEHLRQSRGVVLNQGPHHLDVIRYIGGGKLRTVRAMTGLGSEGRSGESWYSCYCEFEDGTPCTLVYSGSGYFDTAELFGWYGEGGQPRQPGTNSASRRNYMAVSAADRDRVFDEMKDRLRYGSVGVGERAVMPPGWEKGGRPPGVDRLETRQPFFGLMVVSCERGDLRQYPDGIVVYDDTGRHELPISSMQDARTAEIDELYRAATTGARLLHSGRWAKATLEAALAIIQSAEERREVTLQHQVGVPEAWQD